MATANEIGEEETDASGIGESHRSRAVHIVTAIATIALAGVGVFLFLARQTITVQEVAPDEALRRFTEIRARLNWSEPIMRLTPAGIASRRQPHLPMTTPPHSLHVLAYRAAEHRLVRVDVPFWFLKMKGPAVEYSLRGTGFDLGRLGITVADLEQYGACLVLDETRESNDRLLVWTD